MSSCFGRMEAAREFVSKPKPTFLIFKGSCQRVCALLPWTSQERIFSFLRISKLSWQVHVSDHQSVRKLTATLAIAYYGNYFLTVRWAAMWENIRPDGSNCPLLFKPTLSIGCQKVEGIFNKMYVMLLTTLMLLFRLSTLLFQCVTIFITKNWFSISKNIYHLNSIKST